PAASSCDSTSGMSGASDRSICRTPSATRSALSGRSTPAGRKDSCRRCTTGSRGTPSGSARGTATRRQRRFWVGRRECRRRRRWLFTFAVAGRTHDMLRVAIVGCGKIADAHASQIQRIKGCEIVGVVDREPLMARQLYERFPVKHYYQTVPDLLSAARPDVVHITTPPQSHYDLARLFLGHGS